MLLGERVFPFLLLLLVIGKVVHSFGNSKDSQPPDDRIHENEKNVPETASRSDGKNEKPAENEMSEVKKIYEGEENEGNADEKIFFDSDFQASKSQIGKNRKRQAIVGKFHLDPNSHILTNPWDRGVEKFLFGPHPKKNPGQEMEDAHFRSQPRSHNFQNSWEQDLSKLFFGSKPGHPQVQESQHFNLGPNHGHHRGQEIEHVNFGPSHGHHRGQEIEEINFGPKHGHHRGQEIEEIDFGPKHGHHRGQEIEEIDFGPKHGHHRGQEIEEINFGSKHGHPKGQEIEEIDFGAKPKRPIGQEIEEINFGSKYGHPKGQEIEEINFGAKPKHPIGQEIEEINFGSNHGHPKGQEIEEINFGAKPKHPIGQEIEEINFGSNHGHPKGQETEEINFGAKPKHPIGQEIEEINFGSNHGHPKGHEGEEVKLEESSTHLNGNKFGSWYLTHDEGCGEILQPPMNSVLKCEYHRKCEAFCHEGYQFAEGLKKLSFKCKNNTWIIENPHQNLTSYCKPICVPPCENDGICIGPNQCHCPKNFDGPQCRFYHKPCSDHPPVSLNSQVHCNESNCVIECSTGFSFPDGSSSTTLKCHQGKWILNRKDWSSLPNCKPSCDPPCLNGGNCLDLNKCQCPEEYAGSQCQYEVSVCDGEKLNFNGFYSCHGEKEKMACTIKCPEGHKADGPIAEEYVCHYSTGKYLPEPIPKCVYEKNVEVIKTGISSSLVQLGVNGLESGKIDSQVPVHQFPTSGLCTTWTGLHYKTFDGKVFSFDSDCSYTLVQDVIGNYFKIVTEKTKCVATSVCTRTLKIFHRDNLYKVYYKDGVPVFYANGEITPIPIQLDEFLVEQKRDRIVVRLVEVDVTLTWNLEDHLSISVDERMWNKTGGLCSNFNGNPADDFHTSDDFSDSQSFIDTWRNEDIEKIDVCDSIVSVESFCADRPTSDYCDRVFNDVRFEQCFKVERFKAYKNACVWDVCKCGQKCACETVKEFIENCKDYLLEEGFHDSTSGWREIADCPVVCPPGKIYSACGPSVEPACGSFEMAKYSECVEGCFCPEGMFLNNQTCVEKVNCPCQWKKKLYGNGKKIQKECNSCTCQNGEWVCTNLKCGSRCSFTGYSHYLTFDGRRYDFLGRCPSYLLKSDEYAIESVNVPCSKDITEANEIFNGVPGSESYCSKAITVRYGSDEIKLKKHKQVVVNGADVSALPVRVNQVTVRSCSSIFIVVTLPDKTEIWWDGYTNVLIDLPENYEGHTAGLCGTFNGNQKDDFLTPEGDIEQSSYAFGEKWKTDESCHEQIDPLRLHPCESNAQNKIIAEKYCHKMKEVHFKDCHQYVDVEPFYKSCLYDVCSCQKEAKSCFCPILADYGNECSRQNVDLPWRAVIRECGLHCPSGQVYQSCGNSCTRSCEDIALVNNSCQSKCVEGCNCPEGLTLNSESHCIPISTCPCYHLNAKYEAGQELITDSSDGLQFCICENAKWSCRPATEYEVKQNYINSNIKCNESLHEEYTTCEPAEPKTCKNMHEKPEYTNRVCSPGCICKKGFVWDSIGKKCVKATECPCHHGGRSYADGEKIQEDCNICTCENGLWSCTEKECASICSTWGDSHFKTFDGKIYDFQGSCEFVLAAGTLSEYDNFYISLDIVPCGSTGISCPKAVTIKVGPPHKEEQVSFKKSNPTLSQGDLERIFIREAGLFIFAEIFDLGITVQWDKNTRVYVKADSRWKNRVSGLCGNFNNNELDDFKTPTSGDTSEVSSVLFADSWRVQSYCPETRPMPDTCELLPRRTAWARDKCSVLKEDIFEPCHSEVPYESYLERCVVDTCGCDEGGDCECLCSAVAAYAEECTLRGIPIKWRTQHLCALQCDSGSGYNPCVSTCPPKTCQNQNQQLALYEACVKESCVEGCEKPKCPPGQVLADSFSNECVPIASCDNVCLTVNGTSYVEGDLMESDDCHSCFCSHGKKVCSGKPCAKDITLTPLFSTMTPKTTTEELIHTTGKPYSTTVLDCPPGQVWDDCIINCDRVCNPLKVVAEDQHQCSDRDNCLSGCKPLDFECPNGMFLRNDYTCVHKKDCPCMSTNGTLVKPGDVTEISECQKCQCVNNEYECISVCTTPTFAAATIGPSHNYTRKIITVTPDVEFAEMGNVTLIYHTTTEMPLSTATVLCSSALYESLIDDFTKFSASSHLDELSRPENAKMSGATGGWIAGNDNGDQYLQVDLGRVQPVFGVNVAGVSGKYATSYHLLYSTNGRNFANVMNADGKKEVFGGPFDGQHSAKRILPKPVEARYIRFHPISWHEGIGLKVDVLGCQDHSTTPFPTTQIPPSPCNNPLGIGRQSFPKLHIMATSSKPGAGPENLGLHNEKAWQPLTNSKSEGIQLDFGDFGNFTGIITMGAFQADDPFFDESWVERYKVTYSGDDLTWNPVLDDFGNEMIFMGNTDGKSIRKNFFKRPIHAKALRILFVKWHRNIALKMDVMGCYEGKLSEDEIVTTTAKSVTTNCSVCEGAMVDGNECKCTDDKWWDGEKCVTHAECPCYVGLIAYPVKTTFTTEKCEECVCRLYGIPHCFPKECDDCPPGLQKVLTPLCGCTCKSCDENSRLCPTSNFCLEKSAWCNGVEDCPDDEVDCATPEPKEEVTPKPKACQPTCPPGYSVVYRKTIDGPSEVEHMVQPSQHNGHVRTKSTKSVKTYRGSKKAKKRGKLSKMTECPPYDCVPAEEETSDECPTPECPHDYLIATKETATVGESCPLYACEPVPRYDTCGISSQNVKTFDGTEYRYHICDHVLARDDRGSWNVSMVKDCGRSSSCTAIIAIHHGNDTIELNPHNRTVKFDSFVYTESQAKLLNSKMEDYSINLIGNSMIFTSHVHGFEIVFDGTENVRITATRKLKGHLNGLCGLYNGIPEDDKTLPDGNLSKTAVDFGDSWLNPGGKECVETVCPSEKQKHALEICSTLRKEPFASCGKELNMEPCIETVCNCLMSNKTEDECRCWKLSEHASKCTSPSLFGWRVDHDCPSSCPFNLVHYDCYPYACEPTCGNEDECSEPATECFSGCFCPDGMVRKGEQCIKVPDCRDCLCTASGDSTYTTFDGALTFNGNCTYVAARDKNPSGKPSFEVLITNGLCNGSDFLTCTEKVEIKASEHSVKLISFPESNEKVKILVDGVEQNPIRLRSPGAWAKVDYNPEISAVVVNLPKEHVEVRYLYRKQGFTISLPSHVYNGKVEGLCGTCAESVDLENIDGPELWQIDPEEKCLIEPPLHCAPTPEHEKLCHVMKDPNVFGQCLKFVDPSPFVDQCLDTLCLNGHVCSSLEAFGQSCRDVGICVDWRSDDFCPYTCPKDLEYRSCRNGCIKTCENLEEMADSCQNPPVEGCFCPDDDEVLINGTCKPESFCQYCDEEGGHYEGDFWQVDKCTNCTCNNRVVTCNNVKCPVVDVVCRSDQILVANDGNGECCPKPECVCKPRDECPEVEMPNAVLPIGMKAIVNETGCCPEVEVVCQVETCPKHEPCRPHYVEKIFNTSTCCPERVCEKPPHLCVYEFDEDSRVNGSVRIERQIGKEVAKEVGERWSDGPCKSCVCIEKNGIAEAICMVTECPNPEENRDFNEYEFTQIVNAGKCCPELVRKNCKHNGQIYSVGDSWLPDESKPCETMKCNDLGGGQIVKETRLQVCNKECEKGWKYVHADGECCGDCVQVGCVAEDRIYMDGDTWESEDHCATNACSKKNGLFTISTVVESCPPIDDCPEEDVYRDKCCVKCKLKADDKKICFPEPVPPESTVNLIREEKKNHGLCRNPLPLQNFTRCRGNCESHTEYDSGSSTHKIVCRCCRPEEFSQSVVGLICEDGTSAKKTISIPSKCSCNPCNEPDEA